MIQRVRPACGILLLSFACGQAPVAGPLPEAAGPRSHAGGASTLPGVALGDEQLDARAFAAEASFLFPEEARALGHALLRAEFARREGARLGLDVDSREVDAALAASRAALEAGAPGGDLQSWAESRYGRSWAQVEEGIRARLEDNQRFQLCARAWSLQQGRVKLRGLATLDRELAEAWVRRVRNGASAAALVESSLDPGPRGDGTLPWLPARLPRLQGGRSAARR